jgi:hypothetical protein
MNAGVRSVRNDVINRSDNRTTLAGRFVKLKFTLVKNCQSGATTVLTTSAKCGERMVRETSGDTHFVLKHSPFLRNFIQTRYS